MDPGERALLRTTVRDALERAASDPGPKVDEVLLGLGWLEMLRAEPRDAVDVVFTTLGVTNATATVLDDVLAAALGLEPRVDLAFLLPDFGSWSPPACTDGDGARAFGLATARVTTAKEIVVVAESGADLGTLMVPVDAVNVSAVHGIDPAAGFHTFSVEHTVAPATTIEATMWEQALAAGRRAIAHQIAGACRAMLDLACAHALERVQFGRPIARFQAVRHRLADALVALETLEAALTAAWDEPNPMTATLAKAIAGRTARTVATHCQQVLAGIGFTTEHPFHRFLKRTMVLEGILGSSDDLVTDVGRGLLATRFVPTLIEL